MATIADMMRGGMNDAGIAQVTGLPESYIADARARRNLETAMSNPTASELRAMYGTVYATRSNTALRMARVAVRDGKRPSVRTARDAIAWCAVQAETRADGGAAVEAFRLAPYAVRRTQTGQ